MYSPHHERDVTLFAAPSSLTHVVVRRYHDPYPPCLLRQQGCEAASGRPLRFQDQLGGLWTIPLASGTCDGNWLALSAARLIGL
jgi:hypothetical protein